MENFTMVETISKKKTKLAVRPFIDSAQGNMGLENYGLSLYDGVTHHEQLACLENNGVVRYITGLNEFAPEIKLLQPEDRDAKVKEIRIIIAELERELAANIIEPEDKDFWNQVKLLKPDNKDFWNKISISCGNDPTFLDITSPFDKIKLLAIEAGGFSIIAKSYEDARSRAVPPKFYLDKEEETSMIRTEYKKMRNKALAELQKLYDKNSTKLFYIAKVVDTNSAQYRKATPNDVIYENMDLYINGEGGESNKERAAKSFLAATSLDMETLKIKAIVRDSTFFKYIVNKADGYIYHVKSGALLGRNVSDVIEHLKNPLNEDVLLDLNASVEKIWNS
tara:strand:+ start:133 stop:1143 length:1011 start_codon:yes stop_codon:yes gene_type:complete